VARVGLARSIAKMRSI